MTYRERREARAEKRREWAASREAKSAQAREGVRVIADAIPFGQPILVGHHSEKRARKDVDRIRNGMRATIEHGRMADRHERAAGEIEHQLATSVYDDDPDAVERLEAKLAGLEAKRDQRKAANATYRKEHAAALKAMTAYERSQAVPYPSYSLANLGATIRNTKQRIERLKREKVDGPRYREMQARFAGACDRCRAAVEAGDWIGYSRNADERVLCASCLHGGGA